MCGVGCGGDGWRAQPMEKSTRVISQVDLDAGVDRRVTTLGLVFAAVPWQVTGQSGEGDGQHPACAARDESARPASQGALTLSSPHLLDGAQWRARALSRDSTRTLDTPTLALTFRDGGGGDPDKMRVAEAVLEQHQRRDVHRVWAGGRVPRADGCAVQPSSAAHGQALAPAARGPAVQRQALSHWCAHVQGAMRPRRARPARIDTRTPYHTSSTSQGSISSRHRTP